MWRKIPVSMEKGGLGKSGYSSICGIKE